MDSLFRETRDMAAAQRFFRQARQMVDRTPDNVTADGHGAYPRAFRQTLYCDHTQSDFFEQRATVRRDLTFWASGTFTYCDPAHGHDE